MRGRLYRHRNIRLFALALILVGLSCYGFQESHWTERFAEDKVSDFMGNKLAVSIGEISGGFSRDMILQDVAFISGKGEGEKVFRLERMEISYRIWDALREKLGLFPERERPLEQIGIYFSERNPFLQGFIKIYSYPDKLEVMGHISLEMFGEKGKKGIKGSLFKRKDGKYDCDFLWDGKVKIGGVLDPAGRSIDLGFNPLSGRRGTVKIKGSIDENKNVSVYSRLDKVDLFGTEIIGNLWISYRDEGIPMFLVRAESLVVNKQPFWSFFAKGSYFPAEKIISIEKVKWGEGVTLFGEISTEAPYMSELKLKLNNLQLSEIGMMFGNTGTPLAGIGEGEITFKGPLKKANVKGRLYIGEGIMGNMEFRSISAELKGKLPVIKVVNSRAIKDAGHILIDGEIDFSKMKENKVFENLIFETDNKVAVWEDWQISKQEESNLVEAKRDRVTISTSMEEDRSRQGIGKDDPIQNELGLKYKIDTSSSLKIEFDEESDFFGLEHKIEF